MRLERNRNGLRNSQIKSLHNPPLEHKIDHLEFDIAHDDIVLHARKLTIKVTSDTIPILAKFLKERKDLGTQRLRHDASATTTNPCVRPGHLS